MKKKAKQILIPLKYLAAVDRGIEWLDLTVGRKKWLSKMDMSMFDIKSSTQCVAGNVFKDSMFKGATNGYGSFLEAINFLGGYGSDVSLNLGFSSNTERGFQHLQDIWVKRINRMKKASRIK